MTLLRRLYGWVCVRHAEHWMKTYGRKDDDA